MQPLMISAISLAILGIPAHQVFSCSDVALPPTPSGTILSARSLEFCQSLKDTLVYIPRGSSWAVLDSPYAAGWEWTGRYAFAGVNVFGLDVYSDGLNEKGLSCAALWFLSAEYPVPEPGVRALPVSMTCAYILSQFSTVQEALDGVKDLCIWGDPLPQIRSSLPLHFALHDAEGNSAVIEFLHGQVVLLSNPGGVTTNDPSLEWHLTHEAVAGTHWEQRDGEPLYAGQRVHGSGLIGLPGDPTPSSRFLRLSQMRKNISFLPTLEQQLAQTWGIIRAMGVPKGWTAETQTQWLCVRDHTHRTFYIEDAQDLVLWKISLDEAQLLQETRSAMPLRQGLPSGAVPAQLSPR